MAKLLIAWQSPDNSLDDSKTLSISSETLSSLQANFRGCMSVCPFLVFGQPESGKSVILEQFMQLTGLNASNCFSSETEGVHVWPFPVVLDGQILMLLQCTANIFQEDRDAAEAMKKAIACLGAVSAFCGVCMDRSLIFHGLDFIQAIQSEIQTRTQFDVAKFVVFAADETVFQQGFLLKSMSKHKAGRFAVKTEFVYKGTVGVSEECAGRLRELVGNEEALAPFYASHKVVHDTIHGVTFSESLLSLFERLLSVARLPLDFDQFLSKVSEWPTLDSIRETEQSRLRAETAKRMREAGTQPLFIPYFDSVALNELSLQQIAREFVFETPTIVLTVIGPQGLGKSTMLNELIRANTECNELKDVFRTGSSDVWVTKGADILSQPLSIADNQLMLIDLEGLGGHEISTDKVEDIQDLIVETVLALTSVPCIILKNDLDSFVFIEKTVHKICDLANKLGFAMERIHLLYQDKSLGTENRAEAPRLYGFVDRLNQQYFGGLEVIKVRNKPNFRCGDKRAVSTFLSDLLADSGFAKRNYSGSFVNLGNMLDTIRYLTKYSKPFFDIQVDAKHKSQVEFFLSTRRTELDSIYKMVKSSCEGMHLEVLFNEFFRNGVTFYDCDRALESVKDYVNSEIHNAANAYRLRLAQIENCYRLTRGMTDKELTDLLIEFLDYLYKEAWIVNKFLDRADELKAKLIEMRERYPAETETLPGVIDAFTAKEDNLRNWFIANYTIQAAATIATGGLGAAANGARVAVTAARFGYAAAAGGVAIASRLAYGITTTLAMTEKAFRLFTFEKDYPVGAIAKARSLFHRGALKEIVSISKEFTAKIEALPANTPVAVMLVIGGKKMITHTVLNEMVQCVSPFTCSHLETFCDGKSSQSLFFSYTRCHRQLRDPAVRSPSQGLIIYLRMTENESSRKFRMMVRIAAGLMLQASTACVFMNDENQHLKTIFDSLHMMAKAQMRTLLMPKIAAFAIGKNKAMLYHELRQKLRRCGGIYEVRALSELTPTEVKSSIVSLKRDLNHSSSLAKEDLLGLLSALEGQSNALD